MSTICAIATAPGGAIGIVRVSGPQAIEIIDSIFKGKSSLKDAKANTIHYGHIMDGSQMLDEVLISVFRAPHSYTGEDAVEISCHSSGYILKRLTSRLIQGGCKMAMPGEYTKRAFLNGKIDLSQAEAVADLIASNSKAAHDVAINQMRGGISKRLSHLREQLIKMATLLELELDFSEEDVEFADRHDLMSLAQQTASEIQRLAGSFADGNAIRNGIPVAIIGAPNVGKSTLLNALLQDDRAIVSPIEGTTRDIVEDSLTIGGVLFRIIDTAGLRHTADSIEQMGIERSMRAAKKARIILLVSEPGVPFPTIATSPEQTVIRILNKSKDFQAINGTGLEWLQQQLINCVPTISNDTILVTNQRHKQALDKALEALNRAIFSLQNNTSTDLIAEDLNLCLSSLAEIIGAVSTEEILSSVFKNFCIGK